MAVEPVIMRTHTQGASPLSRNRMMKRPGIPSFELPGSSRPASPMMLSSPLVHEVVTANSPNEKHEEVVGVSPNDMQMEKLLERVRTLSMLVCADQTSSEKILVTQSSDATIVEKVITSVRSELVARNCSANDAFLIVLRTLKIRTKSQRLKGIWITLNKKSNLVRIASFSSHFNFILDG